ncbi:MAG: cyclic nucleotide-binding domain-containing protein [Deferribacteres bacterium]|nr:cyclic nucleotide-binding domain-containing protein [candidate division KSB1 bacterium]MCB9502071.1 cyclic nucleotide-binding domain-containing protein [Deferribacteres bacterium]
METLERFLAEHKFLENMKPEFIEQIVGCASNVHFPAGEVICREGRDADKFYFIREGKVALDIHMPQKGSISIMTLEKDSVLGWSWLFPPYRWQFNARAKTDIHAIAVEGACLRAKCFNDHEFGYDILQRFSQILAERLQSTRLQLMDVYSANG